MPLGAVKADNAADSTHDGKQTRRIDGDPAGIASRCTAARYRPLAAFVASLRQLCVTYLRIRQDKRMYLYDFVLVFHLSGRARVRCLEVPIVDTSPINLINDFY